MFCAAPGDHWLDAACPEFAAVLVVVVAAVSNQLLGALPGTTRLSGDRADLLDEWDQLGDVVAVAAGQADGKRDAVAIDDQMVL